MAELYKDIHWLEDRSNFAWNLVEKAAESWANRIFPQNPIVLEMEAEEAEKVKLQSVLASGDLDKELEIAAKMAFLHGRVCLGNIPYVNNKGEQSFKMVALQVAEHLPNSDYIKAIRPLSGETYEFTSNSIKFTKKVKNAKGETETITSEMTTDRIQAVVRTWKHTSNGQWKTGWYNAVGDLQIVEDYGNRLLRDARVNKNKLLIFPEVGSTDIGLRNEAGASVSKDRPTTQYLNKDEDIVEIRSGLNTADGAFQTTTINGINVNELMKAYNMAHTNALDTMEINGSLDRKGAQLSKSEVAITYGDAYASLEKQTTQWQNSLLYIVKALSELSGAKIDSISIELKSAKELNQESKINNTIALYEKGLMSKATAIASARGLSMAEAIAEANLINMERNNQPIPTPEEE